MKERLTAVHVLRFMVLPAALGLIAGLAGGFTAYSELQYEAASFEPVAPETRRTTPILVTAPLPETDIAARLSTLDVPVFLSTAAARLAGGETLRLSDAAGYATVLTSDGWLAVTQKLADKGIVLAVDGALVAPEKTVRDARTGLAFIKIASASLQVVGFEDTEAFKPGTALFARDGAKFLATRFSGTTTDASGTRSDDAFARAYRLDRPYGAAAAGGAVLTIGGNLAGIAVGDGDAFVPVHQFTSILEDVFRGQAPARAVLGVKYVDLTTVIRAKPQGQSEGALVLAVSKAALAAGLKKDDIILRVWEREAYGARDLGEVIMTFTPGDRVRIDYLRAGERQTADIVLQ